MSRYPRRIDRYDIVYQIASGGMASVYVGHLSGPAGFEKLVAIKVIHPHLVDEKPLIDMFLDEARHSARLHHPNIGEVLEAGDEDGLYYMVSELILGQNLEAIAQRTKQTGNRLSQYQVAHIMHEATRGLDAAHRLTDSDGTPLNLVHRDVSPRNVLVSYEGQVKLIDFGVAWARNKNSRTVAGAVKGTTAYLAPELIRGQSPDPRSDIFSVGIVLYELVTGVHPFPAESEAHRLHSILTNKINPPSTYYPGIDPDLENIIMRSLARNKEERFESAQRLCDSLASVCEKSDIRIGSTALSEIMQDIFAEERADHEERLRLFKAQAADEANASSNENGRDNPDSEPPLLGSKTAKNTPVSGRKNSFSPGKLSQWGLTSRPRRVILFTVVILVTLFSGLYWISGADKAPRSGKAATKNTDNHKTAIASQLEAPDNQQDSDSEDADQAMKTIGLTFDVSPPNALMSVDGGPVMSPGGELYLLEDGAMHVLTFTAPGHQKRAIELKADGDQHLVVTLDPENSPPPKKHRAWPRRGQKKVLEAADNSQKTDTNKHASTKRRKKDDALLNNPYD